MSNLQEIKKLINDNQTDAATELLKAIIQNDNDNDEAYFLLGIIYSKKNEWSKAINAYSQATAINPQSPAHIANEQLSKILDFYHHDLYNP